MVKAEVSSRYQFRDAESKKDLRMATNRYGRVFIELPDELVGSSQHVRMEKGTLEVDGWEFLLRPVARYRSWGVEFDSDSAVELNDRWYELVDFGRGDLDPNQHVIEIALL